MFSLCKVRTVADQLRPSEIMIIINRAAKFNCRSGMEG